MKIILAVWMSFQTTAFPAGAVLGRVDSLPYEQAVELTLQTVYAPIIYGYDVNPVIEKWVDLEMEYWAEAVEQSMGAEKPVQYRTHGGKI